PDRGECHRRGRSKGQSGLSSGLKSIVKSDEGICLMTRSNAKLWLLRFSVSHPWVVLWVVGIGLVYGVSFTPQVRLKLNASSLIPTDNPELVQGMKAADLFSMQDMIVIGVVNQHSSIYTPDTLRRIVRISRAVRNIGGVVPRSIVSLATAP